MWLLLMLVIAFSPFILCLRELRKLEDFYAEERKG